MDHLNIDNVYKGPDSMAKYFDPDYQPPIPLVELPSKLNPFRDDNVRIYAKMMTILPAQNVKALPAINMLQKGYSSSRPTVVECSSGSTVSSLALASRALYQNSDVHAYVSNKIDQARLRNLQFFGLKVHLYAGPQQPEITDTQGEIAKLRQRAEAGSHMYNPAQYENEDNPGAHVRWTGPQLLKQLPEINIFCAGMGSAGCVTGTGLHLKEHKPSVKIVGVCNMIGDSIPGPRPYSLLYSSKFPWAEVVDEIEEVQSVDSFRLSMSLSREGLICGPSSGMALEGLLQFLQKAKEKGNLQQYADKLTGEISCVFLCCDLPYQYLNEYFQKLGEEDFPPIINSSLLSLDTYGYDARWELDLQNALKKLHDIEETLPSNQHQHEHQPPSYEHKSQHPCYSNKVQLLDLRSTEDFNAGHISRAKSFPLSALAKDIPSPFDDTEVLKAQWKELNDKFDDESFESIVPISQAVIIVCYYGDTGRMATSILRARKREAYSIKGGMSSVSMDDIEDPGSILSVTYN